MNKGIAEYQSLVFDCDGVVLKSNKVKTQAFYEAVKHYGHDSAQALVDYHIAHGGVSRYAKFGYFINSILGLENDKALLDDLLNRFSIAVKLGLMGCEIAEGLVELRKKTSHADWFIVSGGDQLELRDVFRSRELESLFNGGIFGSPDDKDKILSREISSGNINENALFLGDSKYDYQASRSAGIDFLFISGWTEVDGWEIWLNENELQSCERVINLVEL